MHSIVSNVFIQLLNTEDALSVANYPLSTAYINVEQFQKFCFEIHAGALDSALTFQVKQDTSATQTANIKNVSGATITIPTDGDDKTYVIEVDVSKLDLANGFGFVTLAASGATGNDYGCIVFRGYNARHLPITQPASFGADVAV